MSYIAKGRFLMSFTITLETLSTLKSNLSFPKSLQTRAFVEGMVNCLELSTRDTYDRTFSLLVALAEGHQDPLSLYYKMSLMSNC